MSLTVDDTIVAIASPPGAALRGVVRLSGFDVDAVLARTLDGDGRERLQDISRPAWIDARFPLEDLPCGLPMRLQYWPKSSYTGQPAAELHLVGSAPLLDAVVAGLLAAGARPANRGEFTLRAFLAGRLDLTQAEAVLGVIDAEDSEELATALNQLDGGLSGPLAELRESLLIDLADLEAGLDFADEDLDFVSREQFLTRMEAAVAEIDRLLRQQTDRGRSRSMEVIVLTGPPNAGKSTLLNALAGCDAAIVSDIAGTTRDVIETDIQVGQRTLRFVDTAGIDDGDDPLIAAAELLRRNTAAEATLILYCDSSENDHVDAAELTRLRAAGTLLHVATKIDLRAAGSVVGQSCDIAVSAKTGAGLSDLLDAIVAKLDVIQNERSELLSVTSARCRGSLSSARANVHEAIALLAAEAGDELVAGELRDGLDGLAAVLGRVYTDDILDRVFSRFCIGK